MQSIKKKGLHCFKLNCEIVYKHLARQLTRSWKNKRHIIFEEGTSLWLTQPVEEMIPGLLTEPDGVGLCRLLPISQLIRLHLAAGQFVARDQCVVGWGVPCHVECIHSGSDFQLVWGKNHWKAWPGNAYHDITTARLPSLIWFANDPYMTTTCSWDWF